MNSEDQLSSCIQTHQRYFYNYAKMKGVRPSDIDDVLQITFIEAFKHIDSFDPDKDLKNWICGILNYRILDQFRKAKNSKGQLLIFVDVIEDPIAEEELKLVHLLKDKFDQLFYGDKQLLSMKFTQGMSLKEISKRTGLGLKKTREELEKAKQHLRKLVMEELNA